MAIITCPRCGGADEEPVTGVKCRFCKGAKVVEVDDNELERAMEGCFAGTDDKNTLGMCQLPTTMAGPG